MRICILLLMLFGIGNLYGQPRIFGSVFRQSTKTMLDNAVVTIFTEEDTVGVFVTGSDGRFSFDSLDLAREQVYFVRVSKQCFSCSFVNILLPDSVEVLLEEIGISCLRFTDCPYFDNNVYFIENDTKMLDFDVTTLKELMTEYPTMILEFSMYQFSSESIQLGKKRLKKFYKILHRAAIDQSRICIDTEIHYHDDNNVIKYQLSPGIFGVITAL